MSVVLSIIIIEFYKLNYIAEFWGTNQPPLHASKVYSHEIAHELKDICIMQRYATTLLFFFFF